MMDDYGEEDFDNLPEYEKNRIIRKAEMEKAYLEYLKTEVYVPSTPAVEKRLGEWRPPPCVLRSLEPVKKARTPRPPKPKRDPNEPRPPLRRSGRLCKRSSGTMYMDGSDNGYEEKHDADDSDYSDDSEFWCAPKRARGTTNYADYSAPPSVAEVTPTMIANVAKPGRKKVYSQAIGTTCHQCRQKTIDQKTICRSGRCVGGRGLLCTRCLYTRYGEEVAVVLLNPNWACPHCLEECNASICRTRMGLPPTGQIFSLIEEEYGNVRNFLHQTEGHLGDRSGKTSGYCSSGVHDVKDEGVERSDAMKVNSSGVNDAKMKVPEKAAAASEVKLEETSQSAVGCFGENSVKFGLESIPPDVDKPLAADSDGDEEDFKGFPDCHRHLEDTKMGAGRSSGLEEKSDRS